VARYRNGRIKSHAPKEANRGSVRDSLRLPILFAPLREFAAPRSSSRQGAKAAKGKPTFTAADNYSTGGELREKRHGSKHARAPALRCDLLRRALISAPQAKLEFRSIIAVPPFPTPARGMRLTYSIRDSRPFCWPTTSTVSKKPTHLHAKVGRVLENVRAQKASR